MLGLRWVFSVQRYIFVFAFWVVVLGVLLLSLRISTPIFFFPLLSTKNLKKTTYRFIGVFISGFFVADSWGLLFFLHPAASAVAMFVCSIRLWVGERREEGWTSLLIELVEGRWWEFGGGGEMCQDRSKVALV